MDRKDYDLVVIGGGPAGIAGAATAARFGKSVALIDGRHELGGAGIHTGTAPSKTLRETALALSGARSRNLYGVDLSLRKEATVADFLRHERNVKAGLTMFVTEMLERSKVDVYYGTAIFADDHTVIARSSNDGLGIRLRGEVILIATGSSPVRPVIFPFDSSGVYDSDTILELGHLPKTLAVVGAGVIGSEYASTFSALGTQVHLIDGRSVLLPFLDLEISRALAAGMERNGTVFHWNEQVVVCDLGPTGIVLTLSSGLSLTVEAVMVAAGRKSNTDALNLAAAGVLVGPRGLIVVDDHLRTDVPHVYAAGDVIGYPALASTSVQQGRRAVRYAFGLKLRSEFPDVLPSGVYTIPEVGMVGETEQSSQQKGVPYVVGRCSYNATARGRIVGDANGFLKLIFRRADMRLLGVHALGEQATELVHIGLMAMLRSSTSELFAEACFNIPTFGELYQYAAIDAETAATDDCPAGGSAGDDASPQGSPDDPTPTCGFLPTSGQVTGILAPAGGQIALSALVTAPNSAEA
jgi:NAD(P) transhydrogenase